MSSLFNELTLSKQESFFLALCSSCCPSLKYLSLALPLLLVILDEERLFVFRAFIDLAYLDLDNNQHKEMYINLLPAYVSYFFFSHLTFSICRSLCTGLIPSTV